MCNTWGQKYPFSDFFKISQTKFKQSPWVNFGGKHKYSICNINTWRRITFLLALVKVKRKADSADSTEVSLTKKTKLINDGMNTASALRFLARFAFTHPSCVTSGFCVFVGNLNNSKTYDEVKDALVSYFMTQSLLVQDIRLDRSRWVCRWI